MILDLTTGFVCGVVSGWVAVMAWALLVLRYGKEQQRNDSIRDTGTGGEGH
jgi:hypothetical protein